MPQDISEIKPINTLNKPFNANHNGLKQFDPRNLTKFEQFTPAILLYWVMILYTVYLIFKDIQKRKRGKFGKLFKSSKSQIKYRPYFKNLTLSHVKFTILKEEHTKNEHVIGRNIMRQETLEAY